MRINLLRIASCAFFCLFFASHVYSQKHFQLNHPSSTDQSAALPISFREFFTPSEEELKPSPKLISANGKRVRLIGFMAQMEEGPKGAFYLVPSPLYCDEAGGGTADLPPQRVLVIVRSAKNKQLEFIQRALAVTGILEVGNPADEYSDSTPIRLILDQLTPTPSSAPRTARSDHHLKQRSKRIFSKEK